MSSTKRFIKLSQGTRASASAKALAEGLSSALGYKVWRSIKDFPKKVPLFYGPGLDKLSQYKWFKEHNVPALDFTESADEAFAWMQQGNTVFGRQMLNASCGHGIVVMNPDDGVVSPCPVYTLYRKKKREFRVHVFNNVVVRVTEKKLRSGWDGPRDSKIRNLDNGFVFCHCEEEPEGLRELAVNAAACVQSSFRGVDIGYNEKHNQLFVIEVNSAPGMQGTTLSSYINAIVASTAP